MLNPFQIRIHNQSADEKIIRIWRHHPLTLVGPILRTIAFLIVPILLLLITGLSMFTSPWLFSIFLVILAICLTYAAYEWADWYGDVFVLTNYRMVDVNQNGFFHRQSSEANLSKIQDVSYDIKGIVQSTFNYGMIVIQTAGQENIEMEDIRDPALQTKVLLQAQEKYTEEHGHHDTEMSAEDLIRLLNKHADKLADLPDMEDKETREKVKENLQRVEDQEKSKQQAADKHALSHDEKKADKGHGH